MKIKFFLFFVFIPFFTYCQYAPPAGQQGSTAIAADSNVFVAWVDQCEVQQSWLNISDSLLGNVTYGEPENVFGEADNNTISLGDGGWALIHFQTPIVNGEGFDFAVFENSFSDDFLELAFVEVSSDGMNFFRFPAISNTQTDAQIGTFGVLDATNIHNLAGKYRAMFGTPFDLEDLNEVEGLDIMNIIYVKIIDVIGCISEEYASYDSQNQIINDPFPTAFESGGFDLDAVGIIHDEAHNSVLIEDKLSLRIFPNPAFSSFVLENISPLFDEVKVFSMDGILQFEHKLNGDTTIRVESEHWAKGIYLIRFEGKYPLVKRILKM